MIICLNNILSDSVLNLSTSYKLEPDKTLIDKLDLNTEWKTIIVICSFGDDNEKPIMQLLDCAPEIANNIDGLNIIIINPNCYSENILKYNENSIFACKNLIVYYMKNITDTSMFISVANLVLGCNKEFINIMVYRKPMFLMEKKFIDIVTKDNIKEILANIDRYIDYTNNELIFEFSLLLQNEYLLERYII